MSESAQPLAMVFVPLTFEKRNANMVMNLSLHAFELGIILALGAMGNLGSFASQSKAFSPAKEDPSTP
jgi:hypothetical protein